MRKNVLAIALLGALGLVVPSRPAPARVTVGVSVSLGDFYDELSPYGEWVDCSYGECWVPGGIGAGWQPYSNGEWIWTRYGWTWVSDDPWGGDPYHYGTWAFDDPYGWVWVPGTVWAPAWVTWCYSDSYVGWAPIPPTVRFNASGYSGQPVVVSRTRYVFVPTERFVGTNVRSARVAPERNEEIFRRARPATRFEVSGGVVRNTAVPLATVQRATRGRIATREIEAARTTPRHLSPGDAGGRGSIAIVAPAREMRTARASRPGAADRAVAPRPRRIEPETRAPHRESRPSSEERLRPGEPGPEAAARPRHRQAVAPPELRPRQQEPGPEPPARRRGPEATPPQAARRHPEEARPQQAVRPQEPAARPRKPGRAPEPAGPRREPRPLGAEHAKGEDGQKKDRPGRDGRPY